MCNSRGHKLKEVNSLIRFQFNKVSQFSAKVPKLANAALSTPRGVHLEAPTVTSATSPSILNQKANSSSMCLNNHSKTARAMVDRISSHSR